ncbi:outer membrane protein [Oceanicaulis sp.]|uniref:outer membrane protein n=1 Tax=Oceanicaulis sp. TaxID=1924941 RepID=UPI003D2CD388
MRGTNKKLVNRDCVAAMVVFATLTTPALAQPLEPYIAAHTGFARSDENNLINADTAYAGVDIGLMPERAGLGFFVAADYAEANVESYNWPGDVVQGDTRALAVTANVALYGPEIGSVRPYGALGAGWMRTEYDVPGTVENGAVPFLMDAQHDGVAARAQIGLLADLAGGWSVDTSAVYLTGFDRKIPLEQGPLDANPGIHRQWAVRVGVRKAF